MSAKGVSLKEYVYEKIVLKEYVYEKIVWCFVELLICELRPNS